MKQLVLLTLTILMVGAIAAPTLAGTRIELGATFGLNKSAFYGDGSDIIFGSQQQDGLNRSTGGVFARFDISRYFSIVPQLMYTKRGNRFFHSEYDNDTVSTYIFDVRLDYIELPVLLRFKPHIHNKLNPYLIAGPSISLAVSGKNEHQLALTTSTGETLVEEQTLALLDIYNVADIQFGVNIGVGIDFQSGPYGFAVEGRISADLTNAFSDISGLDEVPEGQDALLQSIDGEASQMANRSVTLMFSVSRTLEF